jgi:large repetitive protein
MTRCLLFAFAFASIACAPDADGGDDDDDDASDDGGDGGDPSHFNLYINEFMASNASHDFDDPDGVSATPDWIELYNPSGGAVDLTGFTITDDLDEPGMHELDGLTLPAHGYLVLLGGFADSSDATFLPFSLDKDEDEIGLYDPDGRPLDRVTFTGQITDVAAGRIPDGGELQFLPEATPGASNPTESR